MTDLTERLRWLLADATPGPWKRKGNDVLDAEGGLIVSFTTAFRADATQKKRDKADPNLVAEAITALPDLLATLETLTQEVERLREALEAMLLYADPNGEGVYGGANDIVGVKQSGQMVLKGSFITTCIRARKALGGGDEQ